jgi:uncharacterized LabA/DUF88 family protein
MEKNKVIAVIDGFNYYHRIHDYYKETGKNLKWLNYRALVESALKPQHQLQQIYFYTAIQRQRGMESIQRHQTYIKALESVGVKVVAGEFKYKPTRCYKCSHEHMRPEEKETDVNIAIKLVEGAFTDEYDTCFLFTADNDLKPPIRWVKENKPDKRVILFPPPNAQGIHVLKQLCHSTIRLRFVDLENNQFPAKIEDGKHYIHSPYSKS